MMDGSDGDHEDFGAPRLTSELLHLETATCPTCGTRSVVADIIVGRRPTLTCMTCGRTSAQPEGNS
jgi:transcription elongation factor Elf1